MSRNDPSRLDNLVALRAVVRALERRFPDHNGPFEYGTRLAEETGELIEALYNMKDDTTDDEQLGHLVKEQQDVLRVVLGILAFYNLDSTFPMTLGELLLDGDDPKSPIEYIVHVGIAGGELANAINHAEGMGVKKEKHGDDAHRRIYNQAKNLSQIVAWTIRYFDVKPEFDQQIAASYRDYRDKGYID